MSNTNKPKIVKKAPDIMVDVLKELKKITKELEGIKKATEGNKPISIFSGNTGPA